ncbi:MAG: PDC sensor domain-containing protein [Promethearchaeota archaeon]
MSKADLEPKLASLMDNIPEIEGLVALDAKGNLIVGQTITEMDLNTIAKAAYDAFTTAKNLGGTIGKGNVFSINMTLEGGSCCMAGNDKVILLSMQGPDAATSISLILRSLKGLL